MDLNSKVCGLQIVVLDVWKAAFFLEVVPSIVNPVNKLYSPAYKVQQTFFVPAKKKHE